MAPRSRYHTAIKTAPNSMPTSQRQGPMAPLGTVSDDTMSGNTRGVSNTYANASKPAPSIAREILVLNAILFIASRGRKGLAREVHRQDRVVQHCEPAERNPMAGRQLRSLQEIVDTDHAEEDAKQHVVSVGHLSQRHEAHQRRYQRIPEPFHPAVRHSQISSGASARLPIQRA